VQEGFDPRTKEYWDELTKRCRRAIPHQFEDSRRSDDDEEDEKDIRRDSRKNRGSGPKFSTGGRERNLRKNEVYVSAERKQAMIDAGVWDDPKLRGRYLKNYQRWDKENANARSR
jgi:hypothetical protein